MVQRRTKLMSTIDRELVRAINSVRCFALIGSGPSCEIGLPSWHKLAETVISKLDPSSHQEYIDRCHRLLSQKDYPSVFSIIEEAIGMDALLGHVKNVFPSPQCNGTVYSYLDSWPFAVYLTTNYDDCLSEYLRRNNLSFPVRRNSKDDFRALRADSKGVIFKIHGDCSTPADIVLTQGQYNAFRKENERKYWREKIRSVLHMINVVLIGYSASDPDFRDQLEFAKDLASPDHPIFMFAADFQNDEIRRYYTEYNIRIIPYKNPDGTHLELHRVLKRYDPFIAKRGTPHLGQDPIDEDKANIASSIFLFTRLNLSDGPTSCLKKSYEALIAAEIEKSAQDGQVSLGDLQMALASRLHVTHLDPQALQEAIESLHGRGFVEVAPDQRHYSLSPSGQEALETTRAERKLREEKFAETCRLFIEREYPNLDANARNEVIKQLEAGLVRAFEKRGAEMAQATFGQKKLDFSTATDILEVVNNQRSLIHDDAARAACADLMLEVLLRPTQDMKDRLADLSQGYFAYHALGLDPSCSDERLRMAKEKSWILDSSIILPLLAKHCINHEFALDILDKIKSLGFRLFTTGRLFDEVIDHAVWAIRNFKDNKPYSPLLLQAASGGPGYKQNLFIDGYMKWAVQQGEPSLQGYFAACLGNDYDRKTGEGVEEQIKALGIEIVDFYAWPDFKQEKWSDRKEIEEKIIKIRKDRGTYRSDEQCRAEAEVLILCEGGKVAFLSQSGILDSIDRTRPRITWTPESMYRFLSSFSAVLPSEDLLYQSMVQDFFYSGFDIVNSNALNQYFSAPVQQSLLNLDEEKDRYESTLGSQEYRRLRDRYDDIPDVQKPFYSMQFAFYVARKESEKREKAEARAKRAEETKALTDKERSDYDRLKAKEAEKKRQGKKKQRRQQSKKKKNWKQKKK